MSALMGHCCVLIACSPSSISLGLRTTFSQVDGEEITLNRVPIIYQPPDRLPFGDNVFRWCD